MAGTPTGGLRINRPHLPLVPPQPSSCTARTPSPLPLVPRKLKSRLPPAGSVRLYMSFASLSSTTVGELGVSSAMAGSKMSCKTGTEAHNPSCWQG